MTHVYLDEWEWDCCGDPFRVGDEIALQVREPTAALQRLLGGALGAGVEATESHHEVDPADPPTTPLRGTVRTIVGVAIDQVEHREPRVPPPAPLAPGVAGWSATAVGGELSYSVVLTPVDGTGRTVPVERVPATLRDGERPGAAGARPAEALIGYLVELDPE